MVKQSVNVDWLFGADKEDNFGTMNIDGFLAQVSCSWDQAALGIVLLFL